ncbi:hypothetical protein PsorP6_009728 [Peronosclerospora sorghi]|uniref:Uncharacterized protein n=1 Tax=Peronosclerospora sorghi TaxID=230839 RepID=A0ACC0VZ75_9STRA|nr:hypothetical protein PsorP6_009728 [Peronosclerospora sorghi]
MDLKPPTFPISRGKQGMADKEVALFHNSSGGTRRDGFSTAGRIEGNDIHGQLERRERVHAMG